MKSAIYFLLIHLISYLRYILYVRKNALQILVPKFGLEGTIYVIGKNNQPYKAGVHFIYDEEVKKLSNLIGKKLNFCFVFRIIH